MSKPRKMNREYVVCYPRYCLVIVLVALVASVVGWCVLFVNNVGQQEWHAPRKLFFGLLILLPISIGFLVAMQERIAVTGSTIESRFLGRTKRLDRQSAKLVKGGSNGFTIADENGAKLFVHNLMQNADKLRQEIR